MPPVLTVNLTAIALNYRYLRDQLHHKAECAAVVKADAYGMGMDAVASVLAAEGCQHFYVASAEEAITLRELQPDITISKFNGINRESMQACRRFNIIPVLNTTSQLGRWQTCDMPCIVHIDTGMNRLGLNPEEASLIRSYNLDIAFFMSHLVCAEEPEHPKNAMQLAKLHHLQSLLPDVPWSLANSSGIFLGEDYHCDQVRPGCSLYGINPTPYQKNPMQPVATLTAPILQVRDIPEHGTIGYGGTAEVQTGMRTATLGIGYADGIFRCLGNKGAVMIAGYKAPIIGRISMDLITVDVSEIPQAVMEEAKRAELLNADYTVDDMARDAGTIGYEIFTRLGGRIERRYRD